MSQRIVIDPVTRIEGHAKITVYLDDAGEVSDARFHVTEFRGFEKFCEGRPMAEMAGITARICGICPISHLLCSAKAGDDILAVTIPPAAEKLRRMMNLGQIVQSHALSFFHLSAPDLLLGMDSDPARRNVFGLIASEPDLARGGIRLRQFGQEIIELLGGKKIHPAWAVPGGVREPLTEENRRHIRNRLPEVRATTQTALGLFKGWLDNNTFRAEAESFGNFRSLFLSLVGPDGEWEHYGGKLRFVDNADGDGKADTIRIVADGLDHHNYREFIGEAVEPWSYLKFPYYKPYGYPDGMYRVGPLARLYTCERIGTPAADAELAELRERNRRPDGIPNSSFLYHYARLIEILAAIEKIERLLDDPEITSNYLRAHAGINKLEGIGVSEAPRGTLFHHYQVDENGLITKVNLIIATGQNNLAMNRTIAQIAKRFIHGVTGNDGNAKIPEGMLNRVEAGIRAFDPCLSCSTHAIGQMPMVVTLVGSDGQVLDEMRRE